MQKLILVLTIALMSVKTYGQIMFQKAYSDSSGWPIGEFVQQTSDGGYIITGATKVDVEHVYLLKTNAYGDTLWTRVFGNGHPSEGLCVRQTLDGGYIIAGDRLNIDTNVVTDHAYLIKTDSAGDTLWTKVLAEGYASSIQQTTDGGYIIGGSTGEFLLIKTNNSGDTLWSRIFGTVYYALHIQAD